MHTRLEGDDLAHLSRLVATWGILADLCFADLLLFVPVSGGDSSRFIVLGQVRPTTGQTLHSEDLVGRIIDESERPLVARAWRTGEIMDGELTVTSRGETARLQCIPVRGRGPAGADGAPGEQRVVGVLTRESPLAVGRRPGELERSYLEVFERFARMIVAGAFPYPIDEGTTAESPRVGDGVLLLDDAARVIYASPNAVSGLHRHGVYSNIEGARLGEVGIDVDAIDAAWGTGLPVTEEVEGRSDVIVLFRCLPLIEHGIATGGIVLLRDVTDVRRRDRLLLSKDATIREIHHRVKNNLQTISALLRLQARRLAPGEGREALGEAERRIGSIALVHEYLASEGSELVDLSVIVRGLVKLAQDAFVSPELPIRFEVTGEAGELPSALATPLAVVITELLQNAVEHGFPEVPDPHRGRRGAGRVVVTLDNDGETLRLEVADDGAGLPEGFSIETTRSLGLLIARDLVQSQLRGTIRLRSIGDDVPGTIAELVIPIPEKIED